MNDNGNYYDQMLKNERCRHQQIKKNKLLNETEGFSRFYPDDMTNARKIIEKRKRESINTHRKAIMDVENYYKKHAGLSKSLNMKEHRIKIIFKYLDAKARQYHAATFLKRCKL